MNVSKMYATKIEAERKIGIIGGTSCSRGYCHEMGCDFPNCATFTDERFDTFEEAKAKYPDLELV